MSVFNCLHLCSFSIKLGVTAIYVCILGTLKNLHQKLEPHCLRGLRECFGEYAWKKVAIPQLYAAETRCSVYASSASLRRPNSIKGWGLQAVLIGLVGMFTSSPRQAGLLKGFISNQVRTSSLDSRHKVSYAQTEPGQCPLSLWHHSAQLFSSVGSSLSVRLLRGCGSRSPVAVQLPLLQSLISSCSGKGLGPSYTDDQVLSRPPGPSPTLPSGFTAAVTQQGYVPSLPTSASKRRAKHVKSGQFSLLCYSLR